MSSNQNLKIPITEDKPSSSHFQEIFLHSQSKPNKNNVVFNPFIQNKKTSQLKVIENSSQQNQNKANEKKIENCAMEEKEEEKIDIEMTKEEKNFNDKKILTEVKEENNEMKT